jgi:putative heme-binding domain-containing protein
LLRSRFDTNPDPARKLGALWSLSVIGGADGRLLRGLLEHEHESVRAWAIRLLTDDLPLDTIFSNRVGPDVNPPPDLLPKLTDMARHDPSGLVRLVLASTLQRSPVNQRLPMARALLSRSEDAADHNLPALIWTGLIPIADADPEGLASLATDARMPVVIGLIARRLGEEIDERPAPVSALLDSTAGRPPSYRSEAVSGLVAALAGRRKARKPEAWDSFRAGLASANDRRLSEQARELDVLFGDGRAIDVVRRLALDESAGIEERKTALRTLIDGRPPDLRAICERLVRVRFLNSVAVRGLALFDDPEIGRSLARNYRGFHPSERPAVIEVLVSRPAFARALLDQIAAGKIARDDVTAFHARQVLSLDDPALTRRLSEVWGALRGTAADRRKQIADLKDRLNAAAMARADRSRGRAIFDRVCASCHRLHGQGGEIGPDLTGSGRDNIDYLLENIVDPGATVSADFRMVVVAMTDGRVLNGMIKGQSQKTMTLQTQTEAIPLDRSEIESIRPSTSSLMPDGLMDQLKADEIRDLVAYLGHPTQVPLPKATEPH